MGYTLEDQNMFENHFEICTEYTTYAYSNLGNEGLVMTYNDNREYNAAMSKITLSNGNAYKIQYGDTDYTSDLAMEAFDAFKEMNYDESLFEQYLINESRFALVY